MSVTGKVLIVTDAVMAEIGILDKVRAILERDGIAYAEYAKVQPEPPVENAYEALDIYNSENCEGVVGLGGGSAIDVAKAVAMLKTNGGRFEDYAGLGNVPKRCAPLLIIPTTAGTGSDVSVVSVLMVNNSKTGILDENITANVALVDPMLTVSVPRKHTAATGIDAFCHLIEGLLSNTSNVLSDTLALHGIGYVAKYLRKAVGDGENIEARYWMAYASSLAGYVMNLTDGGVANHALAFSLGAKYHLPHGLANAVLIRHVLPVLGIADLEKMRRVGTAFGLNLIPSHEIAITVSGAKLIINLDPLKCPRFKWNDLNLFAWKPIMVFAVIVNFRFDSAITND